MTIFSRQPSGLITAEVQVTVPSGTFRLAMAVDTGAKLSVINLDVARAIGLGTDGGNRPVVGVGGDTASTRGVLTRVELDGRVRTHLKVAIVALPWDMLDYGLLGLDFLDSGTFTLDFAAGTISLS